jgi:hypothetical protein
LQRIVNTRQTFRGPAIKDDAVAKAFERPGVSKVLILRYVFRFAEDR